MKNILCMLFGHKIAVDKIIRVNGEQVTHKSCERCSYRNYRDRGS